MNDTRLNQFANDAVATLAARDWTAYGSLFAEDLAMRSPGFSGTVYGRHVRVAMVQGLIDAFPDGQAELERVFGEEAFGCLQLRFRGTHTGPLVSSDGGEIPATGKHVEFPYCMVVRFENDVVAEVDEYYDQFDLLTQIGVFA